MRRILFLYAMFLFWPLVFCAVPVVAAGPAIPSDPDIADRLVAALPGAWDGRAIETPVGPVDYAIGFHRCETGVVAGVAALSVSDHHWQFRQTDDGLRLVFLSTFGGNQTPTRLVVTKAEASTLWFRAPELPLLTLSVTLAEPHLDIRVFHHQQPHVTIRLTRADRRTAGAARDANRVKSCAKFGLPGSE